MKKLIRTLNLFGVVTMSISSMLGSGIFVLPGIAYQTSGPALWIAYLIAGLAILPAAFSKSELATAMPTSGGTYVYIERTYGPLAGTVAGLGLWLSLLFKCSFALVGFGAYLLVFAKIPLLYTSFSLLVIITFLNMLGIKKMAGSLIFIVALSLLSLVGIGFGSLPILNYSNPELYVPESSGSILSAAALVYISYAGVTKIAAIAEEIKNPNENIPRGILISLFFTIIIYSFSNYILAGVLSPEELSGNLKPFYTIGEKVGGQFLGVAMSIVAVLTMTNMANAGLMAAGRFPFAMGRDKLLPAIFGRINRKHLTPKWSILASAVIIAAILLMFDPTKMAKLASAFMIMMFITVNITVILLRETGVQWYNPKYRSPFYPFTQIFGIISGVALLILMGMISLKALGSICIPGLVLYFVYSRSRTNRKGVLGIRGKREDLVAKDNLIFEEIERSEEDFYTPDMDAKVVVALYGQERSPETLIEMGMALAENDNLEVASIVEIPEQISIADYTIESASLKSLRRRVTAMAVETKGPITFDPVVTHDVLKTVFDISQRLHCEWLLVEWAGKNKSGFSFHNPFGRIRGNLLCHLGIFKDAGVRYVRKIMVVLSGDQNDLLVLETADHLAMLNKADITVVKFVGLQGNKSFLESEKLHLKQLSTFCKSRTYVKLLQGLSEVDLVTSQSVEYDLLIFGCIPDRKQFKIFASREDIIIEQSVCSVLAVQTSYWNGRENKEEES